MPRHDVISDQREGRSYWGRRVWFVMVLVAFEYSLDCIIIHIIFEMEGQDKPLTA
jgi:hypothetical protein